MSAAFCLLLATILPLTHAFLDTYPLVAFASHRTPVLDALSTSLSQGESFQPPWQAFAQDSRLCEFDAIVLVEQPGLHTFDLRTLSPSSFLPSSLRSAISSIQMPYVRSTSFAPFSSVTSDLSRRCGAKLLEANVDPDSALSDLLSTEKYLIHMHLPAMHGEGSWRKEVMHQNQLNLATHLNRFQTLFPRNLVVYTGMTELSAVREKRQHVTQGSSTPDVDSPPPPFTFAPSNRTSASTSLYAAQSQGGIFARYQLLTPTLIVILLLIFFVLLPILFLGITALSSVQSQIRFAAPKTAGDKKSS